MRVQRYTYPDDWGQISHDVREKAGWKCEKCHCPHRTWIQRNKLNPYQWRKAKKGVLADRDWHKATRNKVSVHHIGIAKPDGSPGDSQDKSDCRPENLIALCARCHLIADKEVSAKHAAETKRKIKHQRILAAGQLEMF